MEGPSVALSESLSNTIPSPPPDGGRSNFSAVATAHSTSTFEFLRLALDGADLRELTQAVALKLNRPAIFENHFGQLLAWGAPREKLPREPSGLSASIRRSIPNGQVVRVTVGQSDSGDEGSRLVAAVIAHREVAGYLSVVETEVPLSAADWATVWEASLACGVEVVRQRAALDAELRLKGNLLDVLLFDSAGSLSQAPLRSSLVGYDLNHPQTLLVLGIDPSAGAGETTLTLRGLVETLVPWLRREHPMSLVAEKDGAVVLLLGRPGASSRRRPRRNEPEPANPTPQIDPVAARLIEELRREVAVVDPYVSLSAVVASPIAWRNLRRAQGVARRAHIALRLLGERGQTVSTNDPRLAIFLLLDGTEDASLHEFVQIVLGPLLAYDEQHGRVLVDTLAAYLTGEGHIETIARTLQIHPSTLKYRLRRIGEVGGLDLRNPDHRFNAALALRLRGILPPA